MRISEKSVSSTLLLQFCRFHFIFMCVEDLSDFFFLAIKRIKTRVLPRLSPRTAVGSFPLVRLTPKPCGCHCYGRFFTYGWWSRCHAKAVTAAVPTDTLLPPLQWFQTLGSPQSSIATSSRRPVPRQQSKWPRSGFFSTKERSFNAVHLCWWFELGPRSCVLPRQATLRMSGWLGCTSLSQNYQKENYKSDTASFALIFSIFTRHKKVAFIIYRIYNLRFSGWAASSSRGVSRKQHVANSQTQNGHDFSDGMRMWITGFGNCACWPPFYDRPFSWIKMMVYVKTVDL